MKNIKNRNVGLDLLRSLCIVYIVSFWHMLNYTEAVPGYNNIITSRITWIILSTFVFISGYFIGDRNFEIQKQKLMQFYIKKVIRIYPLYLLSILLFTQLGISDLGTSIKAIFLISMFLKPAPPTLWFITMIMLFYVISPFIICGCQNRKIMIEIIVAYIFMLAFLLYRQAELLDVRLMVYFPAFVFGIFISVNEKRISTINKLVIIPLLIGAFISFFYNTSFLSKNLLLSTLLVTTASFFLFNIFRTIHIENNKTVSFVTILSYSSYSMYLFHRPIYITLKKVYFPSLYFLQVLYLFIVGFFCIFVFSFFIQKTYDILVRQINR